MIHPTSFGTRKPRNNDGINLWLISFTDLISLLLALFVLIYAMRAPSPPERPGSPVTAPSTASTVSDETPTPRSAFNALTVDLPTAVNLNYLASILRGQFANRPEMEGVTVTRADDRLMIAFPAPRLFDGGDGFSTAGRATIHLLAPILDRVGNRMEVVGRVRSSVTWDRALVTAVTLASGLRGEGFRHDLVARAAMIDDTIPDTADVIIMVRAWEGER